jgi:hypothetical protein
MLLYAHQHHAALVSEAGNRSIASRLADLAAEKRRRTRPMKLTIRSQEHWCSIERRTWLRARN